ncbi:MAG: RNA polymerase sigma factor [Oscillospiraceae bacterium]|nr:RNA polymerase sigma factor [Oscillospiraceae bacterium]
MHAMQGFDEVYLRHYHDVYLFLLRLSRDEDAAEELTQATFVQALLHIGRFEGRCELRVWLCQIAKHLYYRECKRRGRALPLPGDELPREEGADLQAAMENRDDAFRLHLLLHALEEPFKEVFSLRTFSELPFAQIAGIFGKTESWARVTYHRAKRKLQERMEEPPHED